ncbi:MAG: exonuclease domain-containing protein [Bacteroidota bacterium]
MYAILDIETTGGKYEKEGITEIAIYQFNGHEVTDRFVSLINPERPILPFVAKLTGINNAMLRNAPKFYEVAKSIVEITEECILVAHNADFDYRMLQTEFKRLGFEYTRKTLCTVELSRMLIPGKSTYKLGELVRSLGIPLAKRHRADGDAQATVQLFKLLLAKDTAKTIVRKTIKEKIALSINWLNIIEELPAKTGVYYVHKKDSSIVYIGKSKNIKAKVNQHFTGNSKTAKAIQKDVASVTYEETGTVLIASLKAYTEIKQNQPRHNTIAYDNTLKKTVKGYRYPHENMIVIDKGRFVEERSAILIENNRFKGFGFFNLNYQINTIGILHSIITPMEYNKEVNQIVQSYLRKNKKLKIISY